MEAQLNHEGRVHLTKMTMYEMGMIHDKISRRYSKLKQMIWVVVSIIFMNILAMGMYFMKGTNDPQFFLGINLVVILFYHNHLLDELREVWLHLRHLEDAMEREK